MNRDSLVQVEHLSRYYGQLCAVNDISFEIGRGEVVGFLGPNGAGKSSTMQMITGNLAPGGGRVLINGIDLLDRPEAAKLHLGYLPEQPPLYRDMTVDEYLRFCARLHHVPRGQLRSAVGEARARCGLADVGHRLIGNLSKGYQQRVGIAQAIIHNPAVVILDEPTVGLDPRQIREIRHLIRELGGDHSVILSTHILPEVQAVCDRVQIIHRGELVFNDTIEGMQRQMLESCLSARFRRPPSAAVLAALPDVTLAEDLGGGHWRLQYDGDLGDAAERLVDEAVRHGWRLYELVQERRTLEDVFVAITGSDAAASSGDAA